MRLEILKSSPSLLLVKWEVVSPNRRYTCREFLHEVKWEVVSPNRRYTCREFLHEVNWKVVSPDSTVGIYIQYIYITKIVVLVSEPVRGRSRATELPCCI